MKIIPYIILSALPIFSYGQVVIEGRIRNYNGKSEVYYTHTWDGIHTMNQKSVKPKPNGTFRIKFENEGYGTINIGYRGWHRIFFDSTSKVIFEIDKNGTFSAWGDFKEVNQFYNRSFRISLGSLISVSGNEYSRLISDLETPDMVLFALDSMAQREIDEINKLNVQLDLEKTGSERPDQEIKDFLVNEVRAYYGTVFLNAMLLKKLAQIRKIYEDSTASLTIYNKRWKDLIEVFADDVHHNLRPIPNSSDYNELIRVLPYIMKSYKEYDFPHPKSIDDDIYEKLLSPDSLFLNDSKTVIAYRLNYLHIFLNSEMFYSPALLDAVYQLQIEYPELAHWELLEPMIEKVEASILAGSKDYDKAVILKTHYTSFRDLIGQFRGENLFIDIWATWCGPCVKDFQYKDVIQPFIDNQQLKVLYISIDKPQWRNRWRQSIKYNELQGYHVRANNELIDDMWNVLGGTEGAIPRYALIDRNGNIFINSAARPSQGEKLIEQIQALLQN